MHLCSSYIWPQILSQSELLQLETHFYSNPKSSQHFKSTVSAKPQKRSIGYAVAVIVVVVAVVVVVVLVVVVVVLTNKNLVHFLHYKTKRSFTTFSFLFSGTCQTTNYD